MAGARDEGAVERILRMVSEGSVTPEQAAELLRALPGGEGGGERRGGGEASPGGDTAAGTEAAGAKAAGDGRGHPHGRWRGDRGEGINIDLAALGRLGRHVARRVERELDGLERSARRAWVDFDERDERVGGAEELLWQGAAPADGRLALDVDLDNAGLDVVRDESATEVRAVYRGGDVRGIGIDSTTPRVRLDGDRLVVRQRSRSVILGVVVRSERLTIYLPPAVTAIGGVLHAKNGSERVAADDLRIDRLEMRATNGSARLATGWADELDVHAVNGRVEVHVEHGQSVRASSRNGKVEVFGGARRLDADAGNGKILAEPGGLDGDAAWRLNAGNGRVEIRVPAAPLGVEMRLRSAVAGVDVDLEGAAVRWLRRGVVGAEAEVTRPAGDGAPTLTLEAKATNGRIDVAARAEPAAGPASASGERDRDAL